MWLTGLKTPTMSTSRIRYLRQEKTCYWINNKKNDLHQFNNKQKQQIFNKSKKEKEKKRRNVSGMMECFLTAELSHSFHWKSHKNTNLKPYCWFNDLWRVSTNESYRQQLSNFLFWILPTSDFRKGENEQRRKREKK